MRNGKMTIYITNEPMQRSLVILDDGTNITSNACCTDILHDMKNGKVTIEYEPTNVEYRCINSSEFEMMAKNQSAKTSQEYPKQLRDFDEDEKELEEFDYDETKDILFRKFKEMANHYYASDEDYNRGCEVMDNIAMTLLETE